MTRLRLQWQLVQAAGTHKCPRLLFLKARCSTQHVVQWRQVVQLRHVKLPCSTSLQRSNSGASCGTTTQRDSTLQRAVDIIATKFIDDTLDFAMTSTSTNSINKGDYQQVCSCMCLCVCACVCVCQTDAIVLDVYVFKILRWLCVRPKEKDAAVGRRAISRQYC